MFGLTARPDMPEALALAAEVAALLGERGVPPVVDEAIAGAIDHNGDIAPLGAMEMDALIVVGGDGTILRALQHTSRPVFSINMGALGFLTEVPPEEWRQGIERLLGGDYVIDQRAKLETWIDGERQPDAVNEAVVHTTQISKMRYFDVRVDGNRAFSFRADGLIVATPTGSTCYAMSVGAPIVDPRAHAAIIVPIAPFKLAARPLVVADDSTVEVKLLEDKDALLVLDGQIKRQIGADSTLRFLLSDRTARFIRFDTDFYTRFRRKIARLMTVEEENGT
ncbi:MAG: NAD(+)/NADH kinase [Thermoplasmata archaeon]|nr:NAD(+)/NADH kinase [Thermoplasmata archaeon]